MNKKNKKQPVRTWIQTWSRYFLILLSSIALVLFLSWMFDITDILDFIGIYNEPINAYISGIVLLFTAIVIIEYTKETKRMANLQFKAQFDPSVTVKVLTEYHQDFDMPYFYILQYTNNTRYSVTVTVVQILEWFDKEMKINDELDKIPLSTPHSIIIPPNTMVEYNIAFNDFLTEWFMKDDKIKFNNHIWVDQLDSPFHLSISYSVRNRYCEDTLLTDKPIYYRLKFCKNKIIEQRAIESNQFVRYMLKHSEAEWNEYIFKVIDHISNTTKSS